MKRELKQGLTMAALAMLVVTGVTLYRRHHWESSPKETAEGTVITCRTGVDGEGRGTYTTEYAFKDNAGVDWKMSTSRLSYCLPPGSPLVVEWIQGNPDTAQAREKK
ncbi:MAG: DUF3592 domain-containing protein [Elusimicrobiota bacterium]|nr:MAG: DUF3592 domain-containing protein [Elusimicrobiota bacterium]